MLSVLSPHQAWVVALQVCRHAIKLNQSLAVLAEHVCSVKCITWFKYDTCETIDLERDATSVAVSQRLGTCGPCTCVIARPALQ